MSKSSGPGNAPQPAANGHSRVSREGDPSLDGVNDFNFSDAPQTRYDYTYASAQVPDSEAEILVADRPSGDAADDAGAFSQPLPAAVTGSDGQAPTNANSFDKAAGAQAGGSTQIPQPSGNADAGAAFSSPASPDQLIDQPAQPTQPAQPAQPAGTGQELPFSSSAPGTPGTNNSGTGDVASLANYEPANQAPTDIAMSGGTVAENAAGGTVVATLSATDPDAGESFTYALTGDASGNFEIVGNEVRVKAGATIDYESDTSFDVTVQVTDSGGNSYSESLTLNITDVNEGPTNIAIASNQDIEPVLTDGASSGVTVVGLYAPGSDTNLMDGAPELTTTSDHSYFNHGSLGNTGYNYMGGNDWFQDNGISLSGMGGGTVVFSDGTTGEIDAISNGSGDTESAYIYYRAYDDSADATIDENSAAGQVVATLTASDPDAGETFTYAIADNPDFEIVDNEIRVSESADLNFESGGTRSVEVTVTDSGGNNFTQTVSISLADVQEAPTDIIVTPDLDNADNLLDGAGTGVTVVGLYAPGSDTNLMDGAPELTTTSDHSYIDHDSLGNTGYNYMGGNDWFQDNGISLSGMRGGTVVFSDGTTGEIDAISNGSGDTESAYIYYRAYDPDSAPTVAENSAAGTVVATLSASDADAGDSFTYSLTGDASGNFEIVGNEIRVKAGTDIDFETDTSFDVTVQVTDSGGNSYSETLTLDVSDVNEGPTDITVSGGSVAENAASGTVVATLSASDADAGDSFTYNLTGDASGNFEIVGNEVRVKEGADIDYESDTSFDVTVQVTDSGGNSYSETLTLDVSDINEGPTDIAMSGGSVAENASAGTVVATLSAADADAGDSFTYALTGDASGNFEIVGNEIRVKEGADIDYESDTSFDVTVQVTDSGGNSYSETLTLDVSDVNEGLTLTGGDHDDEIEGGDGNDTIYGLSGNDELEGEGGDDTIYGGAGNDELEGGGGNDTLFGDAGNDKLEGGDGNDTLTGGAGADMLEGGAGDDAFNLSADATWSGRYSAHNVSTNENVSLAGKTQNTDTFKGGDGDDTLNGTDQSDAIFLDDGFSGNYEEHATARIDSIENVNLGAGDDILDMTSNTYNYTTDMTVDAGTGNDTVWSGAGNDTLTGGAGNDSLNGGDGNDLFIFAEGNGTDTIDGGNGGSWTDTIQLQDTNGGGDIGSLGTDWTVTLTEGTITAADDNSITLSDDADGTIVLQDGSQIDFQDIDQITW